MDFINCNLSSADVDTIIFALSVIPKLHLEYTPEQALLNQASCTCARCLIEQGILHKCR